MLLSNKKWLIYGANGYTGRLIAQQAVAAGERPILAGRRRSEIERLARELGCEARVRALDDPKLLATALTDVALVLNCAGPFVETASKAIDACLHSGAHYLDITGEWSVIEHAARYNDLAQSRGCVLMPAVGFDVVPSDCLALRLAQALPTAERLLLAFRFSGEKPGISPGTATTIFSQLGSGTFARVEGQIRQIERPWSLRAIPFASGERPSVAISWGDIASAYYSTHIRNIQVYQALPEKYARLLQRWRWLLPLTRWSLAQKLGRRWIKRHIPGPSASERAAGEAEFWGQASDASGQTVAAALVTPEGYSLTCATALRIVQRVLAGEVSPGFSTPARAFGGTFIEQFPGVRLSWIKGV